MKAHKIKFKNLEGEEVARGYTLCVKREIIEKLNFQEKDLTAEIENNKIIIREVKDEENK